MRVIVPYTVPGPRIERGLHPLCEAALAKRAPQAEMFDLGERHDAYRELLEECWADGRAFLLIEHDIEIRAGVVEELEACPEPWCSFAYAIGWPPGLIDSSLGCTRFSAELLAATPSLISDLPVRDWRRLDCEINPRLRTAGYAPHVHEPAVKHHHAYPAPGGFRCACGEDHPASNIAS